MASSTITNILPRMERLGGPFGMYGTVYGISTSVVHVAHPIPTRAIFSSSTSPVSLSGSSLKSSTVSTERRKRRNSVAASVGASKAPAYNHFKNFCGDGVFTADGDDWKAKRASVMHCLIRGTNSSSSDISIRLEKEANRAADDFVAQISRLRNAKNSVDINDGRSVDCNVVPLLQRSTVGLIYRLITHDEPEWGIGLQKDDSTISSSIQPPTLETSDDDDSSSIHSNSTIEHQSANNFLESYMESIIRIRMIILAQSRSIWFLLPRWCYRIFSSMYKDEEHTLGPIRTFAQQACLNAKPDSPLYQLRNMESHKKGPFMKSISKDLLDEAITLLFAGQDTSAATLSWTLHLLSIHPDIQTRLAEEVRRVFQEEGINEHKPTITKNTISKLTFLDAVVKESMRLYPVAPFVVRRLSQDLLVQDEDASSCPASTRQVRLPANSLACIWIYGLHRNPEFWRRPNDFVPDRWIKPDLKDQGQSNGAYMPFASGPRNCLGQPLANVVLRTILSRLIDRFEFQDKRLDDTFTTSTANFNPSSDLRKDMQAGFTVLPSGGVLLKVRDRCNK